MEQSLGQQFMRDDSSLTNSYSSSIDDYPPFCRDPNAEGSNAETLRHLLQQVMLSKGTCVRFILLMTKKTRHFTFLLRAAVHYDEGISENDCYFAE